MFRFFPVPLTYYALSESVRLGGVKRDWIRIDTLPRHVPASLIASEDAGFCSHHGVEWGVLREVISNGATRGGSTISQQMIKNVFLWHGRSRFSRGVRKTLEIPMTLFVEVVYPKRRIAEIYLNVVEFDTGVFGIEEAAKHHFGVSANSLSQHQTALLIAVLPNPKSYTAVPASPYVSDRAKQIQKGARDVVARNLDDCITK
ncbi:UNVERIFIED_CONTAM: hypothetical protein GTU68_040085 [Idotea baltica]|nr:hypothetical protein [Idotea baltica]